MENGKLTSAINYAIEMHGDQKDKGGVIYTEHIFEVAFSCNEKSRVAGILHDVIEDTDATIDDVCEAIGLTREERNALILLTRVNDPEDDLYMTYTDYVQNIADSGNEIAIEVKRCDLMHNMSPERELLGERGESMFDRHLKALKIISPSDAARIEEAKREKIWGANDPKRTPYID